MLINNEHEVATPFGPVIVSPTGKNHLHVASSPGSALCVNRVRYYVSLHLYRTARGFEAKSAELYASVQTHPGKNITPAAREKVLAEIPPIIDNWARSPEGREALESEEEARLKREAEAITRRITETEVLLEDLRKQLRALQE